MRGQAVIIVNEKAVGGSKFKERKGASKDDDNLQRAFCTKLKFKWLNHGQDRDLKKSEWIHSAEKAPPNCGCITCKIQNTNHENSECFLLVMSSHGSEVGGEQYIRFSDGEEVKLSEIIKALSDEKCRSLEGKPRILILQACRSNPVLPEDQREDPGYNVDIGIQNINLDDTETNSADGNDAQPKTGNELGQGDQLENTNNTTADARQEGTDVSSSVEESDADPEEVNTGSPQCFIPKNFLIVYPSAAGKRAKRDTSKGSWLIDELCNAIDEHNFKKDTEMNFLKILTEAAGSVARSRETHDGYKNAPSIVHRLIEPLIFKDVADESENMPTDRPAL
ncbi:caspase-6-like isoform X1 [Mercenaria mercenaria]|uniref:caspase-6-like isoform X1 n=1 Tax=Mercenaria mercenaria TaxID=6596 RepID=UPI001E1D2900|nr:caspase-6-like isoform X1 [Mercenaria mercenaria]